ncbi:MAG: hypothetical protein Q9209_002338 [Squamulea sp. 1 TL-2023]
MAVQWSHHSPGIAYNQYGSQYGQQASQNHGQQHPQQYGQQMFQQAQSVYPQQPPQQYPQQTPPQQYPQQAAQQQYPHQSVQQQYFSQQQYTPQQQYSPPQQYGPQQYPPQQQFPSQMQYSSHQGGQYQNQNPPISNAAYASHFQHLPAQQGCYNCGSPAHWAQACPEPKRDTPAGAYSRPPPLKRQKPNPPVITKYAVPSHVQQQHASTPQGFAPSYAQQSSAQYRGPHGPPTPQSGQSPHQQWSQQPYQQQQQQAPSHQQQYPQPYQQTGYQHQQQTYVPNAPPTPATPYASHLLNQASPQAAHHNAASYFTNGHYQQSLCPQAHQMSSASPVHAVAQADSNQQQHLATANDITSVRQSSRNSSVSMHSMSVTPSPEPVEVTREEYDDDLSILDVPDIPVVTQGSFANLVDRPLPANFIVADALEPFEPPPPENNGRCQSKYTVIDKLSTFTTCIKKTKYWDDMKSDPIFSCCSESSILIPMEQILVMYRTRREDEEFEPADLEDGEWSRDIMTTTQHEDGRDIINRLENSLARPCVTGSPEVHENTLRERKPLEDVATDHRPDRLVQGTGAMQGPGGQYHWKRKSIRSVPPPPVRDESPVGSPEHTPPMRSRTPSMYELNAIYQQEQGMKPGSSSIIGHLAHTSTANGSGQDHVSYDMSDPFEPPPPPGHLRKLSSYDGAADCPLLAGSANGQVNGIGMSGLHGSNGNGRSYSNGQSDSPNRRRSDAANGRKREPEQVLSDEDNTPKRRQADDTKSKLRKRQPRVAAAYR